MPWTDELLKMHHSAEFRRCLLELDVEGVMRLWRHVAPHLEIRSKREALYTLHLARSQAESVPLNLRQYSAKWLRERGFGSALAMITEVRRNYYYGKKAN